MGTVLWYHNKPIEIKFDTKNSRIDISGKVGPKGHYTFNWSSLKLEIADWLSLLNSTDLDSFYLFQPNNPQYSHFHFQGYFNQHRYYYDGNKYLFKPTNDNSAIKYQYKISTELTSTTDDYLQLIYLSDTTPYEINSEFHKFHVIPPNLFQPETCLNDGEIMHHSMINNASHDHLKTIWLKGFLDTLTPNYHKKWILGGTYHDEPYFYRSIYCDQKSSLYCKYKYMLTAKYLYGYKENEQNVLKRYCVWNDECLWFHSNLGENGQYLDDGIDYRDSGNVYCPVAPPEDDGDVMKKNYYVRYKRYMVRKEINYNFWWNES